MHKDKAVILLKEDIRHDYQKQDTDYVVNMKQNMLKNNVRRGKIIIAL